MIFFFVYLLSSFVVVCIACKIKLSSKRILNPKVKKFGIVFYSNNRHKIRIGQAKVIYIGNLIYLKENNKFIIIKNIVDVIVKNEYMFFKANGEVKIFFNCPFYRYFNLNIRSSYFDLNSAKQQTIDEMLNNLLNLESCIKLKKYLNFIKNTLKIRINNEKIVIFLNKFKIPYTITYKLNNKIKKINIKETI